MLPAEFEPTIPPSTRPQTHALDRAATGMGNNIQHCNGIFGDLEELGDDCELQLTWGRNELL